MDISVCAAYALSMNLVYIRNQQPVVYCLMQSFFFGVNILQVTTSQLLCVFYFSVHTVPVTTLLLMSSGHLFGAINVPLVFTCRAVVKFGVSVCVDAQELVL